MHTSSSPTDRQRYWVMQSLRLAPGRIRSAPGSVAPSPPTMPCDLPHSPRECGVSTSCSGPAAGAWAHAGTAREMCHPRSGWRRGWVSAPPQPGHTLRDLEAWRVGGIAGRIERASTVRSTAGGLAITLYHRRRTCQRPTTSTKSGKLGRRSRSPDRRSGEAASGSTGSHMDSPVTSSLC